jgi:hypothetical protein
LSGRATTSTSFHRPASLPASPSWWPTYDSTPTNRRAHGLTSSATPATMSWPALPRQEGRGRSNDPGYPVGPIIKS